MKPIPLKRILDKYIVPMFTGAKLTEHKESRAWINQRVFLQNVCEMIVRGPTDNDTYFMLRRSQEFDRADVDFVRGFVKHLHNLADKVEQEFIEELINPIIRRTMAERVAPTSRKLILDVLAQCESWAQQTYEGREIAAALGLEPV